VAPALDPDRWRDLPGWELVEPGLADLAAGRATVPALLVSMAVTRLRMLGLEVGPPISDASSALYLSLAGELGDAAHGRYNALVRRLTSFLRAGQACAR
jgi:hypothetical protein